MKNEKKQQAIGREIYDIFDDKVIENTQKQESIKQLTEILGIAKQSSSLEDFINTIESMIEADEESIK